MARPLSASLSIGGPIPSNLLPTLISLIQQQHVTLSTIDALFHPLTVTDLLDAARGETLDLFATDAPYGEFPVLEAYLMAHHIGFDRHHHADTQFDATLLRFRPGMSCPRVFASENEDQAILVEARLLSHVLHLLRASQTTDASNLLSLAIGNDIPPLAPLQFVEHNQTCHGDCVAAAPPLTTL